MQFLFNRNCISYCSELYNWTIYNWTIQIKYLLLKITSTITSLIILSRYFIATPSQYTSRKLLQLNTIRITLSYYFIKLLHKITSPGIFQNQVLQDWLQENHSTKTPFLYIKHIILINQFTSYSQLCNTFLSPHLYFLAILPKNQTYVN